ncbi:MAG: LysR family transcriptional regulator [Sulfitobacter sp.]
MKQSTTIQDDGLKPAFEPPPAFLYGILRSFVALASTLNLSQAVRQLDSTRQTLRRHITLLEELKGGALFDMRERRYYLTHLGERLLPEAEYLISNATSWIAGEMQFVNGLQVLRRESPDEAFFYQQQHQLDRAFASKGSILQSAIKGWSNAEGQLANDSLRDVRPDCIIFRRINGKLVFTEVGENSSFASWFGPAQAQSTIGRTIGEMPGGGDFARLVDIAYVEIERNQGIRLDHIHTEIPKENSDGLVPISYERLLLGGRFPDQSPAIISVVRRTYDLEINGVCETMIRRMPEEALMK